MSGISLAQILIVVAFIGVFILPTILAFNKNHKYKVAIMLINIFGGMVFGTGWLIALIWCFITPQVDPVSIDISDEIEKLHKLKEKGILSQEEFEKNKKKILSKIG